MQLVPTRPEARPLGSNEKAFWKLSEASPLSFAMFAHVRPGLDPARVRDALRGLQARHPLLRARIELRRGRPWFVWPPLDDVPPIELETRAVDRDDWKSVMDVELRRLIPWDRAPMSRALLLDHGPRGASLALFFHHAIADGASTIAAVRDVLWEATTGAPRSPIVHERSIAAEVAIPRSARGLRGLWRRIRIIGQILGDQKRLGPALRPPMKPGAPHERTFHFEQRAYDVASSKALAAQAKAHGTTVHGAVGAAMLFAFARAAGLSGEQTVSLGSPIDVRERLPGVGEQMGMYLAVSSFRGRVSPSTRFWELARAIRERINDDLASGRALDSLPLMELFYRSLGGDKASVVDFGRKWAATNGTTGVTNLGRVDIEAPPGLEVERIQHLAFPSGLDAFNGFASSYGGSIQLTFNWSEPCFDRAGAVAIVDDVDATLRAAIAGDPAIGMPADRQLAA